MGCSALLWGLLRAHPLRVILRVSAVQVRETHMARPRHHASAQQHAAAPGW